MPTSMRPATFATRPVVHRLLLAVSSAPAAAVALATAAGARAEEVLARWVPALRRRRPAGIRLAGEAGEGIISTAIAVLVMAGLGALMWVGFQAIWGDAETNVRNQMQQIGA